jgi:diguanylate cyclase (GGDEF)-like protein
MSAPEVHSLPVEDLDPFLDRHRYAAFAPARLQVGAFLREILLKANDFVPSAAGSILLDRPSERGQTPAQTSLYFVATFGPSGPNLLGKSLAADRGVVGRVYRTGEPYLMDDPGRDPNFYTHFDQSHRFTTTTLIAVPVRIERTVCGVLELVNRADGQAYTARDLALLEIFARYTSVSIENLLDAQRAAEMARRDDLTGLYNDRFFNHRLTEELVRADVTLSSVALLFLDLDNFKNVNDTHGHLAGSQVLKEFGSLLRQVVPPERGVSARYGGDEFVVILPEHDADAALRVANEVRSALADARFLRGSFSWADGPVHWRRALTCSIGIAVYPEDVGREGTTDQRKNVLLREADQAMYRAKGSGKDQVCTAPGDRLV